MISVIFSSHNGGDDLRRTLDNFATLSVPEGGWELIAVDNGSTDKTGDLLHSYKDRLPIKVLSEPAKGKNKALNTALKHVTGDFLIFTDDDILVDQDWLVQWRAVADVQSDYALFAGATLPQWPSTPPQWMLEGVDVSVLYATHEGISEGPCDAACMYGTNMAMRASVLEGGVLFSAGIGPDGTANYAMGSDTEMALRLEKMGHKCWFAAAPAVRHIIPPEHLKPSWILRRGYRWGRGLARMKIEFHTSGSVLKRKNDLKFVVYPFLLPVLPRSNRWRRQWQYMVDRGYEDGERENGGRTPRWPPRVA